MGVIFLHHINCRNWDSVTFPGEVIDGATLKSFIDENCFYLCCNGHKLVDTDQVQGGQHVQVFARLLGGKGGFGSMLRAIGAQIEKTTNREACRDLSGRRLRDINEEMRLKKWIAKQADREQEREARRKEKLERRFATPKHEFRDPTYDKQRSAIPEQVNDALMQGLALAKPGEKRSAPEVKNAPKKLKMWLGDDEELQGESSSSDMETSASCSSTSVDKPGISSKVVDSSSSCMSAVAHSLQRENNTSIGEPLPIKDPSHMEESRLEDQLQTATRQFIPFESISTKSLPTETTILPSEPLNLDLFSCVEELEALGLDNLKFALISLGMKCGGTLKQRAERLFAIKGLRNQDISPSLLAKQRHKNP